MNDEILKIYRDKRKPYASKYFVGVIMGKAGACLKEAKRVYEVNKKFARLEEMGLVRFVVESDIYTTFEDLEGDTYNVELNASTVSGGKRTILAQRKAELKRFQEEGACGIVTQKKCGECGRWITIDSVWGFIGDDWKDSGCDIDIKNTVNEYFE